MAHFEIENEDQRFFRGREKKSLLTLLAIVAFGWSIFFYYASKKDKPLPPKAMSAAAVAPLPPPDEDPAFRNLRDKTLASAFDSPAKELAFRRVQDTPADVLAGQSRRGVTPQELCNRPSRFRGLPIHLEGYAQFVAVDDVPGFTPSNRFYEVWMNVPPDRQFPCCVLVENVPESLPSGRNLQEKIVFDGYFLRLLAYKAVDTKYQYAPMLVGRIVHAPKSEVVPEKNSIWWTVSPLVLIMGYLGFRFLSILRRTAVPKYNSSKNFRKADSIEPAELSGWLAGEAPTWDQLRETDRE